ncbi:hypothetical protein HPP92_018436 [Vanilla planifolia]|uniref:Uncharacterized protein n=1 Tax=Vanilla planifolia TaxID=51239 RepID=A0A835UPD7_VANPL|nr:hypothetical protein HPP92_018436 [Vanilla planifolia]
MASGAASSRRTKRVPAEHRGRRKNANKSLKRRRVSSSPSSYFSDSDDDYRNRRRRVDARRKPEKRRGRDKKRSENRKDRRFRGRNVSSSWDSSSSCSTCRSRSIDSFGRSRSPVRRQEFKKGKRKIKSRGRRLDRGRKISSSCSTCSGSSSCSWSSGRRRSCRDERRKEKGDLGRKGKRRENDDFGLRGSSVMDTLGDAEGKCGSEGKEINTQMNNQNHDFLQAAGGIVEHNSGRVEQDEMMDPGYYDQATETDRWMDEGKVEKDFYFGQFDESAFGRQEAHALSLTNVARIILSVLMVLIHMNLNIIQKLVGG